MSRPCSGVVQDGRSGVNSIRLGECVWSGLCAGRAFVPVNPFAVFDPYLRYGLIDSPLGRHPNQSIYHSVSPFLRVGPIRPIRLEST
ncbi:hypothetical protein BCAR13_10163 [Paraburkholderia caribensis]|nr:hypothetical protein BCAR13_10163 [Paraburkholderia caribensis]